MKKKNRGTWKKKSDVITNYVSRFRLMINGPNYDWLMKWRRAVKKSIMTWSCDEDENKIMTSKSEIQDRGQTPLRLKFFTFSLKCLSREV